MGNGSNLVTVPEYTVYDYADPFQQYGWITLNFFAAIWMVVRIAEVAVAKTTYLGIGATYKDLAIDKQKNVLTYIMQILVTTAALGAQIKGCYRILFLFEGNVTHEELEWIAFAQHIVGVLYLWEMIYRQAIGLPLLIHHIMTMFFFQTGFSTIYGNRNPAFVRMAVAMGMYATTEQLSFIALFCFRLNLYPKWQALLFKIAALQTFIFKTAITFFVIPNFIYEGYITNGLKGVATEWKLFWRIFFVPLLFVLYWAQLYAVKILYSLAVRCQKELDGTDDDDGNDKDDGNDDNNVFDAKAADAADEDGIMKNDQHYSAPMTANEFSTINNNTRRPSMKRQASRRKSDILLSAYENSGSAAAEDWGEDGTDVSSMGMRRRRSSSAARRSGQDGAMFCINCQREMASASGHFDISNPNHNETPPESPTRRSSSQLPDITETAAVADMA